MLQSSNTSRFNRTSKGFGFDEFTRYSSVMFGPRLCVKLMAQVNFAIHRHVQCSMLLQVTRLDWLDDCDVEGEEREE